VHSVLATVVLTVYVLVLFQTHQTTTLLAQVMVSVNLTTATIVLARHLLEVQLVLSVKTVRVVFAIEVLAELLLLEVFKLEIHVPLMLNVPLTNASLLVV